MKQGWVYILECADGSYYTGCTSDIDQRIGQHETGFYSGYTSTRRPVKLVWSDMFPDMDQAIAVERQIKGWTRKKKEALIRGDFTELHELAECKNQTHCRNKKLKSQ
jgi:predicted GIY-YIG superfamily endonuclease